MKELDEHQVKIALNTVDCLVTTTACLLCGEADAPEMVLECLAISMSFPIEPEPEHTREGMIDHLLKIIDHAKKLLDAHKAK